MPEKPSFIERAITAISPAWSLRRQLSRDERQAYQRQRHQILASINGGIGTRLSDPWSRSISYATQTISERYQLGFARDRARKVDRQSPVGRGLLNREVDNVVGEGMTLQARTASEEFNDEAEEKFWEWSQSADIRSGAGGFGAFQRLAYRTARRDGDGAIVLVDQGGDSKLQLVPGDLIRTPDSMAESQTLASGVQVNGVGRPTGYWIADIDQFGKRKFTLIPANQVVFLAGNVTEPLQVRGETCYAQIFDLLDNLDRYVDGVALAAWMATVFGLIFKDSNGAKAMQGLPSVLNSAGNSQRAITLENGAVKYVGKEGEVVQVDARQPMQQTPDFIRMMLRLIGLPFDMPLELVLLDVSQANLSSLRGGMNQYFRASKNRQQVFASSLSTIYRWWVSRMVKADQFTSAVPAQYWPHQFQPRGWAFTDPVKELQAAFLEREGGWNSDQNICAALGRDWDTIQEQQARANAKRAKLGLPDIRSMLTRDPMAPGGDTGTAPQFDEDGEVKESDMDLETENV